MLAAACLMMPVLAGEEATLPPVEKRAEWAKLEEKGFAKWKIEGFGGYAEPLDGGSKIFSFNNGGEGGFEVMVANPAYWTAEERKAGRQVFFVIHDGLYYRVEAGSEGEKQLQEKLDKAAGELVGAGETHPKLVKALAARLKSRDPVFKTGE